MKSEAAFQVLPPQISSISPISISPIEEAEGGLNVGQVVRTLQRKWFVIAGVTLATAALAGTKVLTETPTYSSTLEILVRPISAETEVISNIPETLTSGESVSKTPLNEDLLKILTSPSVLKPVVEKVQARYPEVCNSADSSAGDSSSNIATEAVVAEQCYKVIRQMLNVNILAKESEILQVVARNPDPQKVLFILNAVSDAYLDYSLSSKQADIRLGVEFVNQKLPSLREKVNSLQGELQSLRLDNNLIDPDSRGGQLSDQIASFSQAQLEVNVQLQQMRDVYNNLGKAKSSESDASSALTQNPRYQSLLNSLQEIDAQIAEASTLYLDTSPDMQVLKEQRQNLVLLLAKQGDQSKQEVASQIRELETRQQALQKTLGGLNEDIDDLSGISRRYTDIQRELVITTENLTKFLAKKEALEIDAAQREVPWEIVTPPTAPQPHLASFNQNLILGGLLGLLLGAGIALLLDKSGGVIYDDEEIRRSTRLPVLGRVPQQRESMAESLQYVGANIRAEAYSSTNSSASGAVPYERDFDHAYANDPFSEAFRSLYTNLRLISSDNPIRSVAISSVMPSEGKSTVALHLAEAAAAMGQRVLLVDANLRNPQIHKYLDLSNEKGLTNLFSGESNPALIQKFLPEPNLHVIAAGSAPFEPARLFSSRSMKLFAKKVKTAFDLVIYDTPPLLGQSDAFLIADYADGMLLVTQHGKLKQSLLDRAMEQLQIADIRVLGLVTRES